jgi:hypothetical protein
MESGRLVYSGTAVELREKPELLHSAYLLRGSGRADAARTVVGAAGPASSPGPSDRS